MSLDVYLIGETKDVGCICPNCDHKHTRKETEYFYSANITHNLNNMAHEAGVYEACWCPEKIGATTAADLIPFLREGIVEMEADRPRFEKFNASNGWGLYEHFLPWLKEYLTACEDHPEAIVHVSR